MDESNSCGLPFIFHQEPEKKASPKKTKKTVKTIDLPIETFVHQLPKDQLHLLIEKEVTCQT